MILHQHVHDARINEWVITANTNDNFRLILFDGSYETAKAKQVCDRLIDAARTGTELKITVADLFLEFGKYDEALEYLKSAYADNPDSDHVFNKLGMTLRKSGRLEEAEKFYIQALERQTQDEFIYFNLGRVYLDMKRWKNAIAADRALTINAELAEARKMKLYALKQMGGMIPRSRLNHRSPV